MHMEASRSANEFRTEVRSFLESAFTPELKSAAARQTGVFAEPSLASKWHQILRAKGWVAPLWPAEHGGPGWNIAQRHIFDSECARLGTPVLPAFGIQLVGPVIIAHGSREQKDLFLPRILSGDHYWCQGFSEPHAGSDLAALQTRAIRQDDYYRIDGSKIWTTHAHFANWIFVLVRTNTEARPQAGITFLLVDLSSPGIEIRPIKSISGDHEFNQVYFDSVLVPVANRIGEENQGWSIAKHLLEFERGAGDWSARIRRCLTYLQDKLSLLPPWALSEAFRQSLSELEIQALALEATELRLVSNLSSGQSSGSTTSSVLKLKGSELYQRATEMIMEFSGNYCAAHLADNVVMATIQFEADMIELLRAMPRYLNSRATTIYGGSSEIQKNILAKAIL